MEFKAAPNCGVFIGSGGAQNFCWDGVLMCAGDFNAKLQETLLQKNEADEMNSRLRAMLNEIRARAYNDNSELGAFVIRYLEVDCVEKPVCGLTLGSGQCLEQAPCKYHHAEKRKQETQGSREREDGLHDNLC